MGRGVKKRGPGREERNELVRTRATGTTGGVLRVNYAKWGHTVHHLRLFAQEAPHPRTRERFLALYDIARGKSATRVARLIGREDETVHTWVHRYNEQGPQALTYRRTGGRPPFVHSSPPPSLRNSSLPRSSSATLG